MNNTTYDIITIGGGLAGAALAKALAERGAQVLVLEATTEFRDRVRGEALMPWGVVETIELGLYEALKEQSIELRGTDTHWGEAVNGRRELPSSVMSRLGFYHPWMQERILGAAGDAGAHIRRGAKVSGFARDGTPTVSAVVDGKDATFRARLVVGADGRTSTTRGWAEFEVQRRPSSNLIAGALFDEMAAVDETSIHNYRNLSFGTYTLLFPQGHGRVRVYAVSPSPTGGHFNGRGDLSRFIDQTLETGVPPAYYAGATLAGPLATFDAKTAWVEHPYRMGVALIGDAAATSDPTYAHGLSQTLRDVRLLRDALVDHQDDWEEAGHRFASEHDRCVEVLRTYESWNNQLFSIIGPAADERRARALAAWKDDPTRRTQVVNNGPDEVLDEAARLRFFGEDMGSLSSPN